MHRMVEISNHVQDPALVLLYVGFVVQVGKPGSQFVHGLDCLVDGSVSLDTHEKSQLI